jgi:putative FmdB family regulatory protein
MPTYEYECKSCSGVFEIFETMSENAERPVPHCEKCDPFKTNPTTMERYMGLCRPALNINGKGVFKPGWQ